MCLTSLVSAQRVARPLAEDWSGIVPLVRGPAIRSLMFQMRKLDRKQQELMLDYLDADNNDQIEEAEFQELFQVPYCATLFSLSDR